MMLHVECVPVVQVVSDEGVVREHEALGIFKETDQEVDSIELVEFLFDGPF